MGRTEPNGDWPGRRLRPIWPIHRAIARAATTMIAIAVHIRNSL